MATCFLPSPAFAGWPFRVAYRFPLPGTRRGTTVRLLDVTRGSGKQADLLQTLTPSSPPGRPATARRPDSRVAAASRSALARGPGLPGSSDALTALPHAADKLLQRLLDEGTVIHRRLHQRDEPLQPALDSAFPPPRRSGDSLDLRFLEWGGFQCTLAFSDAERGAPVGATLAPFDPTRREVRHGPGLRLGQKGGHPARHFRLPARHFHRPVAGNAWVTLPPSTGRWTRPRIPATTRSARGRAGNSRSPELLV